MSQYVTGSLYYIDGIAYAKYKGEIKGDTSLSSKAFEDQYDHFKQTTEASAGFSWGDFSIGGSSKFMQKNKVEIEQTKLAAKMENLQSPMIPWQQRHYSKMVKLIQAILNHSSL